MTAENAAHLLIYALTFFYEAQTRIKQEQRKQSVNNKKNQKANRFGAGHKAVPAPIYSPTLSNPTAFFYCFKKQKKKHQKKMVPTKTQGSLRPGYVNKPFLTPRPSNRTATNTLEHPKQFFLSGRKSQKINLLDLESSTAS
jgi:hypothetical protein